MQRIPLYSILPTPPVPAEIHRRHYLELATSLETQAHRFFGLSKDMDVLAVDRATHGLEMCFIKLSQLLPGTPTVIVPRRTYRAPADMARLLGFSVSTDTLETDCGDVRPHILRTTTITVPTTLGGTKPKAAMLPKGSAVVYDCAHTCHPIMFEGLTFTDTHFAVLSFYPTKPAGAFGGGLIIGKKRWISEMRKWAYPISRTSCMFNYPQSVQSWGMEYRLDTYSLDRQAALRKTMCAVVELLTRKLNTQPVFPVNPSQAISPHLLAYVRTSVLEDACRRACLETGNHYPPIMSQDAGPVHLTLPFHTPEVVERLEAAL